MAENEDFVDVEIEDDEEEKGTSSEDSTTAKEVDSDGDSDHDSDESDSEEDERTSTEGDSETDESREAIRERRRQERLEKKQRQREQLEGLRKELQARDTQLAEMRQRLDLIDRRNTGGDLAKIQEAKQKIGQAYNYYKEQVRLGTEAQNGAAVAEATEKMVQLRERMSHLNNVEKAFQRQSQAPAPLDPVMVRNAQDWTSKNRWYDPSGKDADSRIVLTLDNQLAEEGFDPRTQDYWDELSNRVKKYLPHRVNRGNMTSKPKSVVTGSGRETGSQGSKTFRLSADRVKAIKDLGLWDDPEARNKMIKQYRDYDRANEGA